MSKREVVSVPFRTEAKDEADVLKDGLRADGRGAEEARPVFMQAGVNKQASGSAYMEFDDTKVLAAVHGPMQSERRLPGCSQDGVLKCDLRFATFATPQRSKFSQSAEEREMSAALQTALSSAVCLDCIPRAVVHVNALVLDAGGSDLAVCICAASLALADAGIPMLDLLSSCTVSRVEGQLLLDATRNESCRADGSLLLSMMPLRQEVVQMEAVGEWPPSQLMLCLELGMGGCLQLDRIARATLRAGYSAAASTL